MCGIVASISEKPVVTELIEGLKRLEYRGYDSAGLALLKPTASGACSLFVEKHMGKVKNLADACLSQQTQLEQCTVGIAHTRWATHGVPCDHNSHPHVSKTFAVVHNGIIENHQSLKHTLEEKGFVFVSETDTEVLVHLIAYIKEVEPLLGLEEVVTLALSQVQGAYGICVIDSNEPNKIVGARKGSPLILGVSETCMMLASDATAIVGKADKVVYLHDEDLVTISRKTLSDSGLRKYSYDIVNMQLELQKVRSGSFSVEADLESATAGILDKGKIKERSQFSQLDVDLRRQLLQQSERTVKVNRALTNLTLTLDRLEKGGFEHFMLKEIMEQPQVLRDCMRGRLHFDSTRFVKLAGLELLKVELAAAKRLIICACGTSYHSALIGEYLIESLAKVPVEVEYASEFRYRNPILFPDDIVIVISQSGETADTLESVKLAKSHNCKVFGIVNVVGSSIARFSDAGIYLHVGPEIGVASTKAFTGQVATLSLFALGLAEIRQCISRSAAETFALDLLEIPNKLELLLSKDNIQRIEKVANTLRYASNFLYLGRGYNYPTALEGALKLKELSYIHAEGLAAAEMKHGPIALIDPLMPVIVLAPQTDKLYSKILSAIQEIKARKGCVVAITTQTGSPTDANNKILQALCEVVIEVPETREELVPLLASVPLQLLAYYIARFRGCEIDQPRNLAKSVTVE